MNALIQRRPHPVALAALTGDGQNPASRTGDPDLVFTDARAPATDPAMWLKNVQH